MFTCKVENSGGEVLELTNNENQFQVISIEGTNPPSATVNVSKIAMIDGSKFNSSQLNERNLVITLRLNGDVEENRIHLYSFFRTKEWCKIHYANDSRNVYIEGYVEGVEFTPFDISEKMQISIICPNPYFKDEETHVENFNKVIDGFYFPFAISSVGVEFSTINNSDALIINNSSERETGLIMEIYFSDEADKVLIRKLSTNETFTLNYSFLSGDRVIVNTNKGSKSISLIRDNKTSNLFTSMTSSSTFFQLDLGNNIFDYSIDDGTHNTHGEITFKYNFNYGGV